ncbi:MAG: polyprenyl synthetase family protein [Beijerinckiaceae bacterium]
MSRPPVQPDETFSARLAMIAQRMDSLLTRLLTDAPLPGEISRPARLMAAMRHAALAGGKRLRPFLVIETARLFGRDDEAVWHTAAALECVHCYSLVHDDLPAMDDDDLRRGQPTVHRAFDEATAILAGDALLTFAFDILGNLPPETRAPLHGDPRAALVLALARAAGLGGMVGGQMRDLAAEGRFEQSGGRTAMTLTDMLDMQRMKTGALITASVACGAILGGASDAQRSALETYAQKFGAVFQIADDILDVESSAAVMGKATGKDDAKGKVTLVNILGREAARAERDRLVEDALSALAHIGRGAHVLADAVRFAASRSH